jgi:hypothetical protein
MIFLWLNKDDYALEQFNQNLLEYLKEKVY